MSDKDKTRANGARDWGGFTPLTERDRWMDAPDISAAPDGGMWAAWLTRESDDLESLMVRFSQTGTDWNPSVVAMSGALEHVAVAALSDGVAVVACVEITPQGWLLRTAMVRDGAVHPVRAPRSQGKPAFPVLCAAPDGAVWMAWESWHRGRMAICVSRLQKGRWSRTLTVHAELGAYDPAICCDGQSRLWICWTANQPGHHRCIQAACYQPDLSCAVGPLLVAQGGPLSGLCALNSHPSIACDGEGRIWVAWEHDSASSSRRQHPQTSNWIGRREVTVRCWDGARWLETASRGLVFAGHNDHMPRLLYDRTCGLVALSRASWGAYQPGPGVLEDRRTWDIRFSRLTASGWTEPVGLLRTHVGLPEMGRLHRPAAAVAHGAIWVCWQADDHNSQPTLMNQAAPVSWINCGSVKLSSPDGAPSMSRVSGDPRPGRTYAIERSRRPQIRVGNERFTLIWGNCHEHTLLSRCWGDGSDATVHEDYRYGYDIEGYDFIALTDHCFDSWEPVWRETRRAAMYYNDPPSVVANPAYEWTAVARGIAPSSGHRNIVLASDADAQLMLDGNKLLAFDRPGHGNVIDDVWAHMRAHRIDGVTIPHHTAEADHVMNWDHHDPEYQTAVEIFQCRLSSEYAGCPRQNPHAYKPGGAWVWDALARGYRLGFVASGDHNSMGMGRTALLVREISQAGVVEAIRARRCYATTGMPIFLDFRVNGCVMGTATTHDGGAPVITARIHGTAPLREVAIISNCRIVHTIQGEALAGTQELKMQWTDRDHVAGQLVWYYLRVQQTDDQIAWASPVWLD